jgi:hypothetical protein
MGFSGFIDFQSRKEPLKWWKYFRLNINKYYVGEIKTFAQLLSEEMNQWESNLQAELSEQLPFIFIKRRAARPDRSKLFPYRNYGGLSENTKGYVKLHRSSKLNFTVTIRSNIGRGYAIFTNDGKPEPKYEAPAKWQGWLYDVLYKHGRGSVRSVSDIVEDAIDLRGLLREK